MPSEPVKPVSLAQQMHSNRTCLLVSMAVMAMLFFACLVMGFLALYR